ncbi:MAG TPA: family 43 glycosylhydrolase [Iamia sp.]|nr:family 43 glycosylhydrolase [Iamia sp.]
MRTARRIISTVALATTLALGAVVPPAPANPPVHGTTNSTEWYKPGVPYTGVHPDASLTSMGGLLFTYSTNHGSSNLPVGWSADGISWTARTQYEGSLGMKDGYGYYNDGFPDMPWTPAGVQKEPWAPSVAHVGGRWVAFMSVRIANPGSYTSYGRFAIYVAIADNPMGPFRAASSSPIVSTSTSSDPGGAIDPDVMVDETTGRAFLIWKTEGNLSGNLPTVWSRELASSGTGFAGGSSARKLITVSQGWEGRVVENPSMTKVNGRYVLLYSGNEYSSTSYATGYALCSTPTGPCSKSSSNPIIRSAAGAYGPGGADGIVDARGRFIAAYHAWTSSSGGRGTGYRRQHVMELTPDPAAGVRVVRRYVDNGAGGDNLWSHTRTGSYTSTSPSVGGSYIPAAGDFNGDDHDDIAWYGPWDRPDALWTGTSTGGQFGSADLDQRGTFVPLSGDFNADGYGDIYWYQPGPDPKVATQNESGSNWEPNARKDELWLGRSFGWSKSNLSQTWAAAPTVGDFDGNGTTDILWAQPGNAADSIWFFGTNGVPAARPLSLYGYYRPVVGDLDGDGVDDIFWYGPGSAADSIWWFNANGGYTKTNVSVTGTQFRPFAGDFDGNGRDDIIWYAPGPGFDSRWVNINRSGSYTKVSQTINGIYTPVVGDYDANQVDDIFWYS